jgi:CubicO group peptidase (beta-lactamase class C family)
MAFRGQSSPCLACVRAAVTVLLAAFPAWAWSGALPEAAPEEVGLSSQRLELIDAAMKKAVDSGDLPGAVVFIARGGKLAYSRSFGWQDKAAQIPMQEDSIFRLYSMTKPVASVAAMILVEEGKIGLQEPVSRYIPEFKDMKVGIETTDASTGLPGLALAPAQRQISIQDLLRHTSGLTYGVLGQPTAIKRMYNDAEIFSQKWVLADFAKALAKIPLVAQPGTAWEYGHSTDVLGRVIEVASGQTLDAFLAERIFRPLGMVDTGFHVPPEKHGRIAQPIPDVHTGKTPALLDLTKPQTFFAGGHGLVSTAADYLRFAQMLQNGGQLDGVRILGRKTVEYMAANHLNERIGKGSAYLPGDGYGFGLGFATRLESGQSEWPGSPGEIFWGGYAGTYFWIDPAEELVPVYLSQEPVRRQHYRVILRNLVYQALID